MCNAVRFSLLMFLFGFLAFAEETLQEAIATRVMVLALDGHGSVLRQGLGFFLNEETVVTAYSTVKGASRIQVLMDHQRSYSNRLVAFHQLLDLAILKAEEEIEETIPLASSDTIAVGDTVYFFSYKNKTWKREKAIVKKWIDSGRGLDLIELQGGLGKEPIPGGKWEASPLFNQAGKIIGWIYDRAFAVPLKTIVRILNDKSYSLPLAEFRTYGKFWSLHKIEPATPQRPLEVYGMKKIYGPARFPFQLELPESWSHESSQQERRYLMLAIDADHGISVAVRAVEKNTDDLVQAIQETENMLFTGASRSELIPYQAGRISGLKAFYEETAVPSPYGSCVFYALSEKLFYVFSITYPLQDSQEMENLLQQILSSFIL